MKILIIPYHDTLKWVKEGERTRDAHIAREFNCRTYGNVIVLDRPRSFIEYLFSFFDSKQTKFKTLSFSYNKDLIKLIYNKRLWVYNAYTSNGISSKIKEQSYDVCINFNPYASELFKEVKAKVKIFDFYDNFLKIPLHKKNKLLLNDLYKTSFLISDAVIVVSDENFKIATEYKKNDVYKIPNGINFKHFIDTKATQINKGRYKKVVGCAAKITHLIDVELYKFIIKDNPEYLFIHIGQPLDKGAIKKLNKFKNFRFIGDIHYENYPNYLASFDICIVPYNKALNHGGDSIKIGEYIVSKKPVVATSGNGADKYSDFISIVNNKEDFSKELKRVSSDIEFDISSITHMSWAEKVNEYHNVIKKYL